jgi:general secretion pathway protein F
MPIFQYTGYRPDGSSTEGTIEADGLQSAVSGVKALGIYPKDVIEYIHKEKGWGFRRADSRLLPNITRQLSILLASGVPMIDSLRSLSDENSGFWKGLLVDIRDRISAGASLSRALGQYQKIFPDFYRNMVAAGEQSGTLDMVLQRVADFLEKQAAIREKIRTAMVYPAFMASVGFVVMSFLFTFVVPKIVRIFENSQSALPLITVILISISNLFVHYWWALIIIGAAIPVVVKRSREKHRPSIDRMKLKSGLMQVLYYGRFARTLGFLLDGGLPMLRALELSAKSSGNIVLEERIMLAATRVAEGARLSASLEGFPPILLQLISTGEKSGTLVELLGRAADSYEEEYERRVQKFLSLLEPAMILLMGLIVGFIVLAVLLPMFQLNQLVK